MKRFVAAVSIIVMLTGFVEPDRSPLQPLKFQFVAGLAVSRTISPCAYVGLSGFLDTVP